MKKSSKVPLKAIQIGSMTVLLASLGAAQTASLSLSPGAGNVGSVVNMTLSLASTVTQPAALQWTMTYPTQDVVSANVTVSGTAATAGKSITCNNTAGNSKCVIWGINANSIANGAVANVALTLVGSTSDTSAAITVSTGGGASLGGIAIPTSTNGNTLTISQSGTTSVTSISCTPDSVIPPAPSTCVVGISAAAPNGGTVVTLSDDSANAIVQGTVTVAQGATTASFPVATSVVSSDTAAHITASLGASSAMFPLWLVSAATTGVKVDATVSQNSAGAGTSVSVGGLTTASTYELVLAMVSTGQAAGTVSVSSVTGGGLTWVLAKRTNTQSGTSEIWRAFTPAVLSNVTVTANLSASVNSSITVMSFTGVDPSGANGAGAIGATATANGRSGTESASLTTTRDGSLVVGVGNDTSASVARTPGTSQNLVSQALLNANTYWVQTQIGTTPLAGTAVSISEVAPVSDTYNLSAVEILPPSYCIPTLVPVTRSFAVGGGSTNVVVANGPGCAWTATTDSPAWITMNPPSGNGDGAFTLLVGANLALQSRLGTVSIGAQSFKIMQAGSAQLFTDVAPGAQNFDYISLMYHDGITAGCTTSPLSYCPTMAVTRAQMSVFIVVANDLATGAALTYNPTPYFNDVASTSSYFPFVQKIKEQGVTAGCSTNPPLFCPDSTISQDQMAVFMITAWMAANNLTTFTYTQTPYFTDVPSTSPFFKFIQKMRDMQFSTGCTATTYCPSNAVTRSDMAPMIMRAIMGAP